MDADFMDCELLDADMDADVITIDMELLLTERESE
jgi:hypothetical protein